jgi:hypothetical protein
VKKFVRQDQPILSTAPDVPPQAPQTLADLHSQLAQLFKPEARKDLQTAVKRLARALDHPDPEHCALDDCNRPLPTLLTLVERLLLAEKKKRHTIYNTKNFLRRLFGFAEAHHLLVSPHAPLVPRFNPRKKAPRPGSSGVGPNGTYLRSAQWPPDLHQAFTAFEQWATAPYVHDRPSELRKRPVTVHGYRTHCEAFFGYLHHIQHLPTLAFEQLFDITLVTAFVHWHIDKLHHRPTLRIHEFLTELLMLSRQYRPNPDFHAQVTTLQKTIPMPPPRYRKEDAWVSLDMLAQIGRDLWPTMLPHQFPRPTRPNPHPAVFSATHAGYSLMFQLWTFRPYRQRNIREMQLDENLYRDTHRKWRIRFQGEQLKVAVKRGQPNIFDLPFPTDLVPVLEAYLQIWRPVLLAKVPQPDQERHVFLTRYGRPFQPEPLTLNSKNLVYRYTGKHWHPHIIRTVWATEWIRNGGDFLTAAKMLNDTLEMVIKKYSYLLDEDVAEKADRLIAERNGHAKAV